MESATEIIGRIFGISSLRYILIAGIPFLIFYVLFKKGFRRYKIQHKSAKRSDFLRELIHSAQANLIFSIIAFLIVHTGLRGITQVYINLDDYPMWMVPLGVLVALVIHDTYFYWMHRFLHHPKIYRFTHLLHHRSTNPSPFTSYSFHWIESVAEGGILLVVAMVFPMHTLTIVLFTIASFIINVYGHLGYEIMPGWIRRTFLFEIINTSVHHNMHHSRFNYNYGLYFRVWDRLMGTEHPDYVKTFDTVRPDAVSRKKEKKMFSAGEIASGGF